MRWKTVRSGRPHFSSIIIHLSLPWTVHEEILSHLFDRIKRIREEISILSCLKCNRTFKSKEGLIFHDRVAHREKKSYKCEICGGKFADNYHLKRHISEVHEEKKPFKCEMCNSCYFVGPTTYERHISAVHDGKKQSLVIHYKQKSGKICIIP